MFAEILVQVVKLIFFLIVMGAAIHFGIYFRKKSNKKSEKSEVD